MSIKCKECNCNITKRGKYGLCFLCQSRTRRKVERPTKEQLKNDLEAMSFCAVGRKYHVSDNAIRKWIK